MKLDRLELQLLSIKASTRFSIKWCIFNLCDKYLLNARVYVPHTVPGAGNKVVNNVQDPCLYKVHMLMKWGS